MSTSFSSKRLVFTTLATIIFLTSLGALIVSISGYVFHLRDNAYPSDTPLPFVKLPPRFSIHRSVPFKDQGKRGVCWVQSIIGVLEHSYKSNGMKKGFLKKDEYVPFSAQALAIEFVKECQKPESGDTCAEIDSGPLVNSTEGGEPNWLYYLPGLSNKLYPESLCEYKPTNEEQWVCPKLAEELGKKNNPIQFDVKSFRSTYDVEDTKQMLFETNTSLSVNVAFHRNVFYIPCPHVGGGAEYSPVCSNNPKRVSCPPSVAKVKENDRCVQFTDRPLQQDGEWFTNTKFIGEGGHCMQIVGYNDEFKTRYGDKGGFVLLNSWSTPSHTMGYWMNQWSSWNERVYCPNALAPMNWLSCTSFESPLWADPDYRSHFTPVAQEMTNKQSSLISKKLANGKKATDVELCLNSQEIKPFISTLRQPTEFECKNGTKYGCNNETTRYFLKDIQYDSNRLATVRFVTIPRTFPLSQGEYVLNQVPDSEIMQAFQPIAEQISLLKNDEKQCGYFFFPYQTIWDSLGGSDYFSAHYYHIDWNSSSFLVNKKSFPKLDYSWLEKSLSSIEPPQFDGPLPFAKRTDPQKNLEL